MEKISNLHGKNRHFRADNAEKTTRIAATLRVAELAINYGVDGEKCKLLAWSWECCYRVVELFLLCRENLCLKFATKDTDSLLKIQRD